MGMVQNTVDRGSEQLVADVTCAILEPRPFYLNRRGGSIFLFLRAIHSENRFLLFGLRSSGLLAGFRPVT